MNQLGLNSLANRRLEANLTFLRRLIDGLVDSPKLLTMINFRIPSSHARHMYLFSLPIYNTNYSKNQPCYQTMSIANEDPSSLLI